MDTSQTPQQEGQQQEGQQQPQKGLAGLANIGNTCYANSVLQAIRVMPFLLEIFNKAGPSPHADETNKRVFLAIQDIVRTLWFDNAVKGAVCRPMAFWKEFHGSVENTVYDSFRQPIPHDAHEFLVYLLDQCHEALKVKTTDTVLYSQLGNWTSPIVEELFGWDRVECCCETCDKKSVRYEPFNMLKVGLVEGTEGLEALMREERKPEQLDDYVCDGCAPTRTKATIRRTIWRLPRSLFFVVRRFTADGRKDCGPLQYNGADINFSEFYSADSKAPRYTYKPVAVIDHLGSHMGGHYLAQIYHPVLKKWFIFDDEQSVEIDGPRFSAMTYIIAFGGN
jgi:ubiquitin C-terminal hydrolase